MRIEKQSEWHQHDGSKTSPLAEDVLVGDCQMKDSGLVEGDPIRAKSIDWKRVKKYRTVLVEGKLA